VQSARRLARLSCDSRLLSPGGGFGQASNVVHEGINALCVATPNFDVGIYYRVVAAVCFHRRRSWFDFVARYRSVGPSLRTNAKSHPKVAVGPCRRRLLYDDCRRKYVLNERLSYCFQVVRTRSAGNRDVRHGRREAIGQVVLASSSLRVEFEMVHR